MDAFETLGLMLRFVGGLLLAGSFAYIWFRLREKE